MRNRVVSAALLFGRRWANSQAGRLRTPPRIACGQATGSSTRVFYLAPDAAEASGGVRVIYRHVDFLNQLGFDASVLHPRGARRAWWFENDTRVASVDDVLLTSNDILVVPELYGANLDYLADQLRLVIFNQGAYHTFSGHRAEDGARFLDNRVEAILTVSEDSRRLLQLVFESTPVHCVRSVIEPSVFHPPTMHSGRRRLAYVTSRRGIERNHLLTALAIRQRLVDWDQIAIEGMTESAVAEALRGSAIFLSFSQLDGFGLPPAEAMACGCYVIGFHGQGGQEYFDPSYCHPIKDTDLHAFICAVEEAAASYDADPELFGQLGLAPSNAVLERYDIDGLKEDLLEFYRRLGVTPG